LLQCNTEAVELRRHRWVDGLVATFDVVPEFARQCGDAAHEGAGDT
jgi:hypothetical protein